MYTTLPLQHLIRRNLSLIFLAYQEIQTDPLNDNSVLVKRITAFHVFTEANANLLIINL